MSTTDVTITSDGDVSGLIAFSTDAWNIWMTGAAFLCVLVVCIMSAGVQFLVYVSCHSFCGRVIRDNDSRRNQGTKLLQSSNPLSIGGLTSSRVDCIQIVAGWLFLVLVSAGILLYFECRATLILSMGSSAAFVLLSFVAQSQWFWAFLLRFVVLWYDIVRPGDIIVYRDREIGRVFSLTATGIQYYTITRDHALPEAHRAHLAAKMHDIEGSVETKFIERTREDEHKDEMIDFIEKVAHLHNAVPTKFVPYTVMLNPEFAWILHERITETPYKLY